MTGQTQCVAMLAGNLAFGAILSKGLEEAGFKVAIFYEVQALTTFLRISPVDTVILDAELAEESAIDIAKTLRAHKRLASPLFEIAALTRGRAEFHHPFYAAGIDLVLQKPVTPARLAEALNGRVEAERAVAAHGGRRRSDYLSPRGWTAALRPRERLNNVIQLFTTR